MTLGRFLFALGLGLFLWAACVLCGWNAAHAADCPPTPDWAVGRGPNCELQVDGGPGYDVISFDLRAEGQQRSGQLGFSCPGARDTAHGCPLCNAVVHSSTIDNYRGAKNSDVFHPDTLTNSKFVLVKNTLLANAWVCEGGAWQGPGGISCASGETTSAHADVLQALDFPNGGGWLVVQGSGLLNSDHQIGGIGPLNGSHGYPEGGCKDTEPAGGVLLQDVEIGNTEQVGLAQHYIADCKARCGENCFACESGNQFFIGDDKGQRMRSLWLVAVRAVSPLNFIVPNGVDELVVIGGSGGRNGWPGPLGPGPSTWTGPACPDGLLVGAQYNSLPKGAPTKVYCYHSIPQALADGRVRPPFLQLSLAGWDDDPVPPPPPPPPPPPIACPDPTAEQCAILYPAPPPPAQSCVLAGDAAIRGPRCP